MSKGKKKHRGPPVLKRVWDLSKVDHVQIKAIQSLGISSLIESQQFNMHPATFGFEVHNRGELKHWVVLYLLGIPPSRYFELDECFAYTKPTYGGRSISVQDEMGRLPTTTKQRKSRDTEKQEGVTKSGADNDGRSPKRTLDSIRSTAETLAATGYPHTGVKLEQIEGNNEGYAIDCEMCLSGTESVLTRMAVVRFSDGEVMIDELVKPKVAISDYLTPYSGITPEMLKDVTFKLEDAQHWLRENVGRTDTLIGHSLDNDLKVLGVQHPHIVDTALLYPHYRGLPYRSSLKYLAKVFLEWDIQKSSTCGHNPVEDATACQRLVNLILRHGPEFGDEKLHRVAMTTLFKQNGLNSTIIGPGVPTWDSWGSGDHISESCYVKCVDSTLTACKNSDFVCCTLDGSENRKEVLKEVSRLVAALPKRALVTTIIPPDQIHVDEVRRLENKKRQYKYEYRTKKWDAIENPWTIEDDNALQSASNLARVGRIYANITFDDDELSELGTSVRAQTLVPPIAPSPPSASGPSKSLRQPSVSSPSPQAALDAKGLLGPQVSLESQMSQETPRPPESTEVESTTVEPTASESQEPPYKKQRQETGSQ